MVFIQLHITQHLASPFPLGWMIMATILWEKYTLGCRGLLTSVLHTPGDSEGQIRRSRWEWRAPLPLGPCCGPRGTATPGCCVIVIASPMCVSHQARDRLEGIHFFVQLESDVWGQKSDLLGGEDPGSSWRASPTPLRQSQG